MRIVDDSEAGTVTWWTTPVTLALGANAGAVLSGTTTVNPASGVAAVT